ncbi:unnamed protein product [Ranitomeya imitator]|uniref:Reverse transcriptase domain-containing protein n=1 Tax=Ranitomeya imitator TaxID=111125 RepID=A0ABN9MGF4_9NEOB|nr:unnamed protein product [Ranitomeya imitator]
MINTYLPIPRDLTFSIANGIRIMVDHYKSLGTIVINLTEFLVNLHPDLRWVSRNYLLVTLDVNSLYTSIEHTIGIWAIQQFLENTTLFSDDLK